MSLVERKSLLRAELKTRRKALGAEARAKASLMAARHILALPGLAAALRIGVFWPFGTEIDTKPLAHALFHLGYEVFLPRTHGRAEPLSFHLWTPETVLARSAFGVEEPGADLPLGDPEWLIVPLLGFDAQGYRLGYGAGHYDCTLASMRARGLAPETAGLAFACQRLDEVPREAHDAALDWIVTEAGLSTGGG